MSTDIIYLALEKYTDWSRFEGLATEMMASAGYADIKPLGGTKDGGKDAVVERYYKNEGKRSRTVFQFSLQKDVMTKVMKTIERLNELETDYQKLVIVTNARLGSERQEETKRLVRKEFDLDLEIFELGSIVAYLSDLKNGAFTRFFPDIRRQVDTILATEEERSRGAVGDREYEFLKVSCAFSFNPSAPGTRRSFVDQLILSLISLKRGVPVTPQEVLASAETNLGKGIISDVGQVTASIGRLVKMGWLDGNGVGRLSAPGKVLIAEAEAEAKVDSEVAIADIVAEVGGALGGPISDDEILLLKRNCRNVLAEYFRLNGLELANSILSGHAPTLYYGQAFERLKEMAGSRLPEHLGTLLLDAIGSALLMPTAEQAKYFANCSRAYLASGVMNIDPALREFQATRMAKKVFVLV